MITSRQNALIKQIKSFSDKKNRDEQGVFVIESVKLVLDAYSYGVDLINVICTEKGYEKISGIIKDVKCELVSDDVFLYVSQEKTPQGVLAVASKPENTQAFPQGNCVLCDGISDPLNVGAILRTAAASGYNDVYLADSADAFNGKAVRASMGGVFRVRVHFGTEEQMLKLINVPIIVADMNGENAFSFSSPQKFCLAIGNEARGVSQKVREKAKYAVSIPMQNGVESLNASVSAGILMYALKNN